MDKQFSQFPPEQKAKSYGQEVGVKRGIQAYNANVFYWNILNFIK